MAYPRFRQSRAHKQVIRTANASAGNDYSLASTTYVPIDATNLSIDLRTQVGDMLKIGWSSRWQPIANQAFIDFCSIVGGSVVSYMSGAGSGGDGVSGLMGMNTTLDAPVGAAILYTVVNGDLSGGKITVRPYFRATTTTARLVYCRTTIPIHFWVENLGPPAT